MSLDFGEADVVHILHFLVICFVFDTDKDDIISTVASTSLSMVKFELVY